MWWSAGRGRRTGGRTVPLAGQQDRAQIGPRQQAGDHCGQRKETVRVQTQKQQKTGKPVMDKLHGRHPRNSAILTSECGKTGASDWGLRLGPQTQVTSFHSAKAISAISSVSPSASSARSTLSEGGRPATAS